MAVKIKNRTYNEIYTDGETDWLLGNVGEWQTLKLECEVAIEYLPSINETVEVDRQRNALVLSSGKNWGDFGFDPGMPLMVKYKHETDFPDSPTLVGNTTHYLNITNISGKYMEVAQSLELKFLGLPNLPSDFGDKRISNVKILVDQPPEGCRVKYVHLTNENFDTNNLSSFIDQSLPEFVRPNINDSNGNFIPMEAVGIQSGMSIRKIEIKKIGKKAGTDNTYQFEILIQYMISSIFEDATTFENITIPSYLSGDGSLTDNFLIEFYPEWNNPNTVIRNELDWTTRKGNTGWFNENFNQLKNDFSVVSLQYFDENGNVVDSLDYATATKVKAVIAGVPNLDAQTECGFGFAWIPNDEVDFKDKETALYRNLFVQSGSLDDGFSLGTLYPDTYSGAGIDGAAMDSKNIKFTQLNGNIIFEATLTPNAAFFTAFDAKEETDRNFVLWVSVADGNLKRNFTDRVSLILGVGSLLNNIPPAGEYPFIDNLFIEHPFESNALGESNLNAIVQDDLLCRLPFRIPKDGSIKFDQISFGVEAFNLGLGSDFALEKIDLDVKRFPVSNGIQQIDIDQIRGFKLNPGNNKNLLQIKREALLDTVDFAGYIAYFATKIRWEDWLLNPKTPDAFFDADKANNGFNHDWVHYLETNGWNIQMFAEINTTESGVVKQYKNQWKMSFVDYDKNMNVDVSHRYLRDSDDAVLNVGTDAETGKPLGVILANEPTRIEMDFDILDAGVWDIAKAYAVITIEIDKGAGRFEQRQLSSVWESELDNPLKPIVGETRLKLSVDGTNKVLTAVCLVDPDLLTDAVRYRVTGRVGCKDETGDVFDPGLYEFRYESTYE